MLSLHHNDSVVQFVIVVEQLILADSENFIDTLLVGAYFACVCNTLWGQCWWTFETVV